MNREKFLEGAKEKAKAFWYGCLLKEENCQTEHFWDHTVKLCSMDDNEPGTREEWERQIMQYQCLFGNQPAEITREWYEVQTVTEQVCVVYGSITAGLRITFLMVCRQEMDEAVICNIHHSLHEPKEVPNLISYMLSRQELAVPDEIKRLQQKCSIDMLTGIYNRGFMEELINHRLMEEKVGCAFIMVDMDDFKLVNDTWGHVFGDKLLKQFANFLKNAFIAGGEIGRIGGDEFCVFISHVISEEFVVQWIKTFFRLLEKEDLSGKGIPIYCSVGICFSNNKTLDFIELYDKADQALYQAKKQNKGGYIVYGENMI